jgi:hypothetical protein
VDAKRRRHESLSRVTQDRRRRHKDRRGITAKDWSLLFGGPFEVGLESPQLNVVLGRNSSSTGQDRSKYTEPEQISEATDLPSQQASVWQQHALQASRKTPEERIGCPLSHQRYIQHINRSRLIQRSRTTPNLALSTEKRERTHDATYLPAMPPKR